MDGSFFFKFKIMFNVGTHVVLKENSQYFKDNSEFRNKIFEVQHGSCSKYCYFLKNKHYNCYMTSMRPATPLEIIAYNQGITNINDIKDMNYEIY